MCGKKTTYEFMLTYLRNMLEIPESHDIIIATGTIDEGQTKRWLLGWRFINLSS